MLSCEKVTHNSTVYRSFTSLDQTEFDQLLIFFTLANERYIEQNHIKGKSSIAVMGTGVEPNWPGWKINCCLSCSISKPIRCTK